MPIDRKLLAQMRSATMSTNSSWWRPKDGENRVRLLSFKHVVTSGDHKLGRVTADYPEGSELETFFVSYRKHWKPQAGVCGLVRRLDGRLIGNCTICDAASATARNAGESEKDAAARWKPSVRYAVQVIDLSDTSREIKIWDAPGSLIEHIHSSSDMFDPDEELFGVTGRDLCIRYNPKATAVSGVYGFFWVDSSKNSNLTALNVSVADLYHNSRFVPPEFRCYVEMGMGAAAAPSKPMQVASPAPAPKPPTPQPVVAVAPEPDAVKRGRGRPRKVVAPPEPLAKLGAWVKFYNVEGDPNSELLAGRITAGPNEEGMWTVQLEDTNLVEIKPSEIVEG